MANKLSDVSGITDAAGLTQEDRDRLYRLMRVWGDRYERNALRRDFYHMHVDVRNIGIAVSDSFARLLDVSCGWPKKAVDMPAERSILDAFVTEDGERPEAIDAISRDNRLMAKYSMAVKSELTHGLVHWTLSRNPTGRTNVAVKLHSAESSASIWDGSRERVECGMAIIATRPSSPRSTVMVPSVVNMYTDDATIVLTRSDDPAHPSLWSAEYKANPMGRPLIEPMVFEPTVQRPLGQSRITRAVMSITMSKLREDMRSEISAEFFTTPQKYLLGADDDAFDMDRYSAYIGNIFLAGKDEDGDVPTFGQLPQGSMQPHTEYTRSLAAQFSGETSIPISSLGVIHDNPASAEAIAAAERDLVQVVEHVNETNGECMRNVMLMAQAINKGAGTDVAHLDDTEYSVTADFHDPSMPNIVSQADAWQKLATAAPWVAETEEFLEGVGIPYSKRVRMLNQKRRIQARSFLEAANGADTQDGGSALPEGSGGGQVQGGRVDVQGVAGALGNVGDDGGVVA